MFSDATYREMLLPSLDEVDFEHANVYWIIFELSFSMAFAVKHKKTVDSRVSHSRLKLNALLLCQQTINNVIRTM